MKLPELKLPESLNYIAAFFTMQCHLACGFCINANDESTDRKELFNKDRRVLPVADWIRIINRIPCRDDLPITAQGGEPLMYKGFGEVLDKCGHYFDLLTAFPVSAKYFAGIVGQNIGAFTRPAPYPSIRVSYHPGQNVITDIVKKCVELNDYGFFVSDDKSKTNVGIWMVAHPDNVIPTVQTDVYFETKEFLGVHNGVTYGAYKYPNATDAEVTKSCECKTSELLIDPMGRVFQCHAFLYNHWLGKEEFDPIGSMLDPEFTMDIVDQFRPCTHYGHCSPCDVKIKNNRFQSLYDTDTAHCSVEIRNIK